MTMFSQYPIYYTGQPHQAIYTLGREFDQSYSGLEASPTSPAAKHVGKMTLEHVQSQQRGTPLHIQSIKEQPSMYTSVVNVVVDISSTHPQICGPKSYLASGIVTANGCDMTLRSVTPISQ